VVSVPTIMTLLDDVVLNYYIKFLKYSLRVRIESASILVFWAYYPVMASLVI
jgi:hypothetical protein